MGVSLPYTLEPEKACYSSFDDLVLIGGPFVEALIRSLYKVPISWNHEAL